LRIRLCISQRSSLSFAKETLNKSPAAAGGSFTPAVQFEKLEIHPVFLRFPNFHLVQNLSPSALVDLIRASLSYQNTRTTATLSGYVTLYQLLHPRWIFQ